jgi:hypothetical protein
MKQKEIHIAQIYSCSNVSLACELYYICELGKYAYLNYGVAIDLEGVILKQVLKQSPIWDYFRLAVSQGYLVKTGVDVNELRITAQHPIGYDKNDVVNFLYVTEAVPFDRSEFNKRQTDVDYDLRTPVKTQVSFEYQNEEEWKWSSAGENGRHFTENNKAFNHNHGDQSWLSLIAMVAIERIFNDNKPYLLSLEFDDSTVINVMALSYIMLISDESTAFNGWITFDSRLINEEKFLQLSYTAWYAKGRDMGLLKQFYTAKEKFEYAKLLDIVEGDMVMLYERGKSQNRNYVKNIASCHLAKVVKLTDESIVLDKINTVKPYSTAKHDFEDHTIVVKRMYNNHPYKHLNHSLETFSLIDVGVEYYMWQEKYFIVPLDEATDMCTMYVDDGNGRSAILNLDQNELTYWILKDYDYKFNEERFLNKLFYKRVPLYTRFMSGDDIEEEYFGVLDNEEE